MFVGCVPFVVSQLGCVIVIVIVVDGGVVWCGVDAGVRC